MIAVNDARSKHLFDNRYGTGQSTLTAVMTATNLSIAGKTVVVAGYGMCGKGVVKRAIGMGANVIVTEIDPVCAAEAVMDGCRVMKMDDAAALGDFFITVTGCKDVIRGDHFAKMKNGAVLCNAGHFDVEINIPELEKMSKDTFTARNNVQSYVLDNGNVINILAQGRLVNLAAGDGHPVEIMDMSFALQAKGVEYLARNGKNLSRQVINVPKSIDDEVANTLLKARNIQIDVLTEEQFKYNSQWIIG
jgi:adenosylhomocysteinase